MHLPPGNELLPTFVVAAAGANRVSELLVDLAITWGIRIAGVVIVLSVAWVLAGWARRSIYALVKRANFDQTVSAFFGNLVRWAVLVLGVVACLSIFGINIAAVTAVIGAAGLAIGLAMQGSLANLAAGIMLLVLRPFRIGDAVVVAGQAGKVNDIDLFNTKLDTPDNRRLIVPNSAVFAGTIENQTHHARRRVEVVLRIPFAADSSKVRAVLNEVATNVPKRLSDLPADAGINDVGNLGVLWGIRAWCLAGDYGDVKDALIEQSKRALEAAGVSIANGP
jgi:small conductance mechanosensitive channel